VNINIIPIVVGAIGTTPKTLEKTPKRAGKTMSIELGYLKNLYFWE